MRRFLLVPLLALSLSVHAGETLRVGQQVLTMSDTALRTLDLLGTPVYKEPVLNVYGAFLGERWQYVRENGHVIIVTIIAGQVASIDNRVN